MLLFIILYSINYRTADIFDHIIRRDSSRKIDLTRMDFRKYPLIIVPELLRVYIITWL